jgi:hypothetical protein
LLAVLEDPATRGAIVLERQLLAEHGGGCHQRFGATLQWLPGLGGLLRTGGRSGSNVDITGERWLPDMVVADPAGAVKPWDGSHAPKSDARQLLNAAQLAAQLRGDAVFVAHSRALPSEAAAALRGKVVWTSGSSSWFRLAAQGVWVQGCGEAMGAEAAAQMVAEPLLRLPPPAKWSVLTHAAAVEPWAQGAWSGAQVIATYEVDDSSLPDEAALKSATHVFWSSTAQFERGRGLVAPTAHHASGPGKTAEHIRGAGVRHFQAFPTVGEWRKWTARAR